MAVRRSRPGARRQKAYSQIVNCRSEEQYAKVHKQAGEKLEEMSGASGHTLMTMLKTHIVKDVKKSGPGKLIGLVAGLLLGVFGLLKLKDQIEEWEAEEEERLAIAEAEEEARRMAEEEAARARKRMQQAQAAKARAANSARS